jgi:hypothetical protein
MSATTTLYRPAGPKGLALIRKSRSREFRPRLEGQPAEFNSYIVAEIEAVAEFHAEEAQAS